MVAAGSPPATAVASKETRPMNLKSYLSISAEVQDANKKLADLQVQLEKAYARWSELE